MKKILAILLLVCALGASRAEGAIALVANAEGQSDGCNITTGAIDTTGANLLLIYVAWQSAAGGTLAVSDSKSNTWNALTPSNVFQADGVWYYATSVTVGSGHTFSVDCVSAVTRHSISVTAWSGAHATAPFDQENGTAAEGVTSIQPGSVTPSENNELVVVGVADLSIDTRSIDGGFTKLHEQAQNSSSPFQRGMGMAYLIQTTATAANPTWSGYMSAVDAATRIATFKAAAGGGGGGSSPASLGLLGIGSR